MRVARRRAFHERNLERLVDGRLRLVESRYTLAELERVEERVEQAYEEARGFVDGWGDDGILIRTTRVAGGRVIVELVSARDDYAAVLRELYGPAVEGCAWGGGTSACRRRSSV